MIDQMILTCIDQKELLFVQLLNLTKRIEVRCRQEDVNLDDFTEQRQVCLDRVAKCNALIEKTLLAIEDPAEQTHLRAILKDSSCLPQDCTTAQEVLLLADVQRCRGIMAETSRINDSATKMLQAKRNEMWGKITELRLKEGSQKEIFHF